MYICRCINNLPVPKPPPGLALISLQYNSLFYIIAVTGAAQVMGDMVTGRSMDTSQAYTTASLGVETTDGPTFDFLADALSWRAHNRPDDTLYTQVDSRVTRQCHMINILHSIHRAMLLNL